MTRYALLILGLSVMCGCGKTPNGPIEHTGMGRVLRVVHKSGFWDNRMDSITHESDAGFIKVLTPICYGGLDYVSAGQRVNITFYWWAWPQCYKIEGAQTK